MRTTWMLIPALAMIGLTNTAMAETDSSFGVGLALGHEGSIYRDMDAENGVLPFVDYKNGNFFVRGLQSGYFFWGDKSSLRLGGLIRYRMEGYKADDSDFLTGMKDRKGTLEGGLLVTYPTAYGNFAATALMDLANKHDGYEFTVDWNKPLFLSSSWVLTPEASLSYRSDKLNNYYYGVTDLEAEGLRTSYTADAGYGYSAGLNLTYLINQQQMLILGFTYKGYDNEVTNSSIVDKTHKLNSGLVYSYKF